MQNRVTTLSLRAVALLACALVALVLATDARAQSCSSQNYNRSLCDGTAPFCEGKNSSYVPFFFGEDPDVVEACERHDGDDLAAFNEFSRETRDLLTLMSRTFPVFDQWYLCDYGRFQFDGGIAPFKSNGTCGSGCWTGKKRETCYNERACNIDRCSEQGADDTRLAGRRLTGTATGTRPPAGYGYSNAGITQDLHRFRKRGGSSSFDQEYCWCLYEKTFDSFEGTWDHVATTDAQAEFSRTLSQGTSLTTGEQLTKSHSESISVSVGANYTFIPKVFEGSVTITGTLSQTTSQMMSESINTSITESCTVNYPAPSTLDYNFLQVYQWSMRGFGSGRKLASETKTCNTFGLYSMTQETFMPRCPLGDCADIYCQECLSGSEYKGRAIAASREQPVEGIPTDDVPTKLVLPDISGLTEEEILDNFAKRHGKAAKIVIEKLLQSRGPDKTEGVQQERLEQFKEMLHEQYPEK